MEKPKAHISEEKKQIVNDFVKLFSDYPIVGIVDMENLPAQQLTNMRKQLRESVVLIMTKRRLINLAIDKVLDKKKGIEKLRDYMKGMPAILFTKEDPFKLYKIIGKNKSKAPIKAGQTAPNEIVVPAGPTSFAPGPIIGELGSVGIKAGVEEGKIAIKEDCVVAKGGDVVSSELAGILTRLGIEPMEVGLNLVAVYDQGTIYDKSVLAVDEQEYIDNLTKAHSWAFNLSVEAGIYNSSTIEYMIGKVSRETKALAKEADILTSETVGDVLAKAEAQAKSLKDQIPEAPKEEKAEEPKPEEKPKKEEKPAEEKKEEAPAENNDQKSEEK
ncbi:50S ribosomal protein L10 [Nanoarchaeota archaeon]